MHILFVLFMQLWSASLMTREMSSLSKEPSREGSSALSDQSIPNVTHAEMATELIVLYTDAYANDGAVEELAVDCQASMNNAPDTIFLMSQRLLTKLIPLLKQPCDESDSVSNEGTNSNTHESPWVVVMEQNSNQSTHKAPEPELNAEPATPPTTLDIPASTPKSPLFLVFKKNSPLAHKALNALFDCAKLELVDTKKILESEHEEPCTGVSIESLKNLLHKKEDQSMQVIWFERTAPNQTANQTDPCGGFNAFSTLQNNLAELTHTRAAIIHSTWIPGPSHETRIPEQLKSPFPLIVLSSDHLRPHAKSRKLGALAKYIRKNGKKISAHDIALRLQKSIDDRIYATDKLVLLSPNATYPKSLLSESIPLSPEKNIALPKPSPYATFQYLMLNRSYYPQINLISMKNPIIQVSPEQDTVAIDELIMPIHDDLSSNPFAPFCVETAYIEEASSPTCTDSDDLTSPPSNADETSIRKEMYRQPKFLINTLKMVRSNGEAIVLKYAALMFTPSLKNVAICAFDEHGTSGSYGQAKVHVTHQQKKSPMLTLSLTTDSFMCYSEPTALIHLNPHTRQINQPGLHRRCDGKSKYFAHFLASFEKAKQTRSTHTSHQKTSR